MSMDGELVRQIKKEGIDTACRCRFSKSLRLKDVLD